MWPFSKKADIRPNSARKPDDWTLGQGERDGFPMIVRMANAYKDLAPLQGYDHHVIVSVHLRNPRPNGFPSSEEADDLTALELNVCRLLEADNDSLCSLVITNNGLRDFIFYSRNVDAVRKKLEDNPSVLKGFVSEIAIEPARDWEIYRTFSDSLMRTG
jgi:hypothetical protein